MEFPRDEALRPFATERQWEIIQAYWETGSQRKAAAKLGIAASTVQSSIENLRRRAAKKGYSPDHDMTRTVPDGYMIRGISTLYNAAGEPKLQWVKSQVDRDRQEEILREAAAAFADPLPRAVAVPAPRGGLNPDLLACIPIGDHHQGMHAWRIESGDSYDLKIAQKLLCGATDHLVAAQPPCETSLIAVLGDYFHYDSMVPATPKHGNILDSDSRFGKIIRMAFVGLRYTIEAMLKKHGRVHIIVEIGNHDPVSSLFMMEALRMVYETEPRVTVDTSPGKFHYFEFGKNLIGTHHGDTVKMERLPLIMAIDQAEAWGRTIFRYIWTGHVHKDAVQDNGGARVESFRVMPPLDAWAHGSGYRPMRSMTSIILHREFGEQARYTVNPNMLGVIE